MKKSILALMFLLFSGIAFSQTTVTLQDQCNCEVLKGTDVSSPGAATPTGADLGDIYVIPIPAPFIFGMVIHGSLQPRIISS